ncbi:protein mono-ADP-ribosyltransferase PARP11-like [Misgurnus anguillicaudatus]|uniref:protein mono-ADP-ribosyltransferase PARP11-like n=1 Tax=Misgurnus anguillicaudatus TaxID=75329 RepID=UPI003CCEFE90
MMLAALAGSKVEDEVEYMDTSDTPWYWFYKTESGVWHRVEDEAVIFMSSAELERYYIRHPYGVVNITTAGGPFKIDFANKIQVNLTTGQTRQLKRSCLTNSSFSNTYDAVSTSPPAHWENADPEKPYQVFPVRRESSEYQQIESFVKDVGQLQQTIVSIFRVQNIDLWELFSRKKIQLMRIKGESEIEEQKLFHGTSSNNLHSICTFNFNCRLPERKIIGHVLGKGTYFAKHASYAYEISKNTGNDTKIILLARVIVGKYKTGRNNYCTPNDDEDKYKYDSCVDRTDTPSIFVIFDSNQIYPEYVLQYR